MQARKPITDKWRKARERTRQREKAERRCARKKRKEDAAMEGVAGRFDTMTIHEGSDPPEDGDAGEDMEED